MPMYTIAYQQVRGVPRLPMARIGFRYERLAMNRVKTVLVRAYLRFRFGEWETVISHYRAAPVA